MRDLVKTYFDENKDTFRNVDYLSYTFNGEDLVPEEKEVTPEEASALASAEAASADETDAATDADTATEAVTEATGDTATEAVSDTEAATDTEAVTEATPDTEAETEEATDEEKLPYYEIAKSYADRAKAAKSEDEFKSIVEEYLRNERYPEEEAEAETEAETGDAAADAADATESREDNIKSALDALLTEGAGYSDSSDISKQLFEAKTGETVADESGADSGKYVVYFVTQADYVEDYATKKANAIIIEAEDGEEAAETTVDKINSELDANDSDEKFAELAKEYSVGSSDGKYEKINKSFFPSDEITDWLFDDSREEGDRDTFTFSETEDGEEHVHYCVIKFVGDDILKWQSDADSALKNKAWEDKYNEFSEAYESKITVDLVDLYKIPH